MGWACWVLSSLRLGLLSPFPLEFFFTQGLQRLGLPSKKPPSLEPHVERQAEGQGLGKFLASVSSSVKWDPS